MSSVLKTVWLAKNLYSKGYIISIQKSISSFKTNVTHFYNNNGF